MVTRSMRKLLGFDKFCFTIQKYKKIERKLDRTLNSSNNGDGFFADTFVALDDIPNILLNRDYAAILHEQSLDTTSQDINYQVDRKTLFHLSFHNPYVTWCCEKSTKICQALERFERMFWKKKIIHAGQLLNL